MPWKVSLENPGTYSYDQLQEYNPWKELKREVGNCVCMVHTDSYQHTEAVDIE